MEPEDRDDTAPMAESMGQPVSGSFSRRREPPITAARRKELLALALELAAVVQEKTKPRERCLVRQMVELLVGEE